MFTAVGDDDQAIYAWRGATIENLKTLQVDFPNLHLIKLEQNYRSSTRILQAANSVISNNPKLFDKALWSEHGLGDPIKVMGMDDDEAEAEQVAILLSAHRFERHAKFSDYAILYRGNHQSRIIEKALRRTALLEPAGEVQHEGDAVPTEAETITPQNRLANLKALLAKPKTV